MLSIAPLATLKDDNDLPNNLLSKFTLEEAVKVPLVHKDKAEPKIKEINVKSDEQVPNIDRAFAEFWKVLPKMPERKVF